MDANIQVMHVHLMGDHEQRRVNLFQAAGELRAEGYNVPKIAPFLDPPLSFIPQFGYNAPIDLATAAGKDAFVDRYKHFYNQYFSVNTDAYADNYIARINNKPVLNTWHILPEHAANRTSLSRADVESRMSSEFAAQHPEFANGVYMIGTGLNETYPTFADERMVQFETHDYFRAVTHNGVRTAQLKAGYWDQNLQDREPGAFIPRAGGSHYTNAWNTANNATNVALNLRRINIESWNEYDEGSGIYEGDPGPPFISQYNESGNTDTWSSTNNPRQYIDTTAASAKQFNSIVDRDAKFLYQNFPNTMYAGTTRNVRVVARNEGDNEWSAAQNYRFGQQDQISARAEQRFQRQELDDTKDEIPKYGGIFRGRPKIFDINIVAPAATGNYTTHWSMLQENFVWFGEVLTIPIQVLPKLDGDTDVDGDVDFGDVSAVAASWRTHSGADWLMGDFDSDHDVDRADLNLLAANYFAGAAQARADFESLVPHWVPNDSGSWDTASNWSHGVPNGVDATVTFGNVITADRLVYSNAPVTLGTMTFNDTSTYLLAGLGTLTMQVSGGTGLIEVLQGAHKINLPLTIASDTELNIAGGAALLISDPVTVAAGKNLTQTAGGTVTYQSLVTLQSGASMSIAGAAEMSDMALASDASADVTGRLTIKDADYTAVESKVKQGFNGGDWLGKGITSSAAANDPKHATALGLMLKSDDVLVKYTYYGDTDLDGVVELDDFERFLLLHRRRRRSELACG